MTNKNNTLTYFLTQSLFLGFGIALLFFHGGKDTYIGVILGSLIGFGIISIFDYFIKLKKDKQLKEILQQNKKLGLIARGIFMIISFVILLYLIVIYKLFVSSFLLTKTPVLVSITPFLLLALFSTFKGLTNINRVAKALLPISIVLFILSALSLTPYFEFDYFKPIFTKSPFSILHTAWIFASISIFPNILTIHFNSTSNVKHTYLISCIVMLLAIIFINGVLGEKLINIFRFPEYLVLKQLKFLNFLEKLENVLAIPWLLSIFVTTSLSIYSLKELGPTKNSKLFTTLIILFLIFIITKILPLDYSLEVKMYYALPFIATIFIVIVIGLLFIIFKKANSHQQYNKHY